MGRLLTSGEKALFDSINYEILDLAGAEDALLWSRSLVNTTHSFDPLYGEPTPKSAFKSFTIKVFFEKPAVETVATDEGLDVSIGNRLVVNRMDLERNKVPANSEGDRIHRGDIIELFSRSSDLPTSKWYFEITAVDRDGFMNDSRVFTQYTCDYVRRDFFPGERKL